MKMAAFARGGEGKGERLASDVRFPKGTPKPMAGFARTGGTPADPAVAGGQATAMAGAPAKAPVSQTPPTVPTATPVLSDPNPLKPQVKPTVPSTVYSDANTIKPQKGESAGK